MTQVRARSITGNPRIELETGETMDLVILRTVVAAASVILSEWTLSSGHLIERPYGRIHVETPVSGRAYERFTVQAPGSLPIDPDVYGFVRP